MASIATMATHLKFWTPLLQNSISGRFKIQAGVMGYVELRFFLVCVVANFIEAAL